ncbi:MAG: DUF1080 domain-containing protein, partial [Candidatus Omnitrophica bacterium]|nr:DUF1080 domain-containing protein [Candidatus Omnitrophota bacterium]
MIPNLFTRVNGRWWLPLVAALWATGLIPSSAGADGAWESGSSSCGTQVLKELFDRLGLEKEPERSASASRLLLQLQAQANLQKGLNSLYEIQQAAQEVGLQTLALQTDLETLPKLLSHGQLIANVTGNMHFCLITGMDTRGVTIYDPGLNFKTPALPLRFFQQAWDGTVLVVSRQPLNLEELAAGGSGLLLSDARMKAILGGESCGNCTGSGGTFQGAGGSGRWSRGNGADPNSSNSSNGRESTKTQEPVQIRNGNLFLEVTDVTIPTRGMPLEFTRFFNAQTVSEVPGWLPEPSAGTWTVENGEYSGQGDRSTSDLSGQDVTVTVDMQTLQPGANPWDVGWVHLRYAESASNPRDVSNSYYFLIHTNGTLELSGWKNGTQRFLTTKSSSYQPTNRNTVKFQATGSNLKVYVNGKLELDYTDSSPLLATGRVALEAHFSHVHFDNITIAPAGQTATTYDFSSDDNESILGLGWRQSYSMRIQSYPNHLTLVRENGAREIYALQADGTYQPVPLNTQTTLIKDSTGFSVRTKYGLHYRFDLTGKLLYVEDRNLNRTTLTYGLVNGKTVLTNITEPAGRSLTLTYDANGRIASLADPAGKKLLYTYDAAGHLTTVTDRLGFKEQYAYDPITHNLTQLTDKESNRFSYSYTYNDRVLSQIDPLGNKTTFDYLWNTVHVINQRGEITKYNFDPNSFLQSVADPANATENSQNDANGNILNYYDKNSILSLQMTYDSKANRTQIVQPGKTTTKIAYDPTYNLPTSVTDPKGNTTTFSYDAKRNLLKRTDPLGNITAYTVNSFGQVLSVTDPKGNQTTFTYDVYGNLSTVKDPMGNTTTYTTDILGRRTKVADSVGTISQFTYDAEGRLLSAADALNQITKYAYTANGRVSSVTDPMGNATKTTYDCFGNLLTVTDAKGQKTSFTYDTANQMHLNRPNFLSVTDPKGQKTFYEYDSLGRQTKISDAAGNVTRFSYDAQGNLLSRTDALVKTTAYTYDGLNRIIQVTRPDSTLVKFIYDLAGNLVRMEDPTGTTYFGFDALNRPLWKVFPDQTVFNMTYDAASNRSSFAIQGVGTTNYGYDPLNRLTQLTAPGGRTTRFAYDTRSRRSQLAFPNGVTTNYTYDLADRLTTFKTQGLLGVVAQSSYAYDVAGRRTQAVSTAGPTMGTLNYSYDTIHQLLTETGSMGSQPVSASYAYDPAGNRTQRIQGGVTTTYSHNALNQLTQELTGMMPQVTFTYDANGNRVRSFGVSSSNPEQLYTYDFDNRLKSFAAGPTSATYSSNGFGERVAKTVNGVTTTYYQDGPEVILEKTGANSTFYLHGPGLDELISSTVNGVTRYYHQDALGSVVALTDS